MDSRILALSILVLANCKPPHPEAGVPEARPRDASLSYPTPLRDGESLVPANGVAHWVRVAGAARQTTPLVIVHGGPGGNNYAFERTIGPELEKFTTVIYYEQRGCGRSKPPRDGDYSMATLVADLDALRAHLDLPRIALLGYSFGGALALEYAIAHPDRVERLVLQAPMLENPSRNDPLQIDAFEAISQGDVHERIRAILRTPGDDREHLDAIWNTVDAKTVDALLFRDPANAIEMRRLWAESKLGPNVEMRQFHLASHGGDPLLWRARGLSIRTLVLIGLYDRNTGVEGPRELAQVLPRAGVVLFERSAHFPDLEEPAKYAATVRSFLSAPRALHLEDSPSALDRTPPEDLPTTTPLVSRHMSSRRPT